jgi:hypothetical protein
VQVKLALQETLAQQVLQEILALLAQQVRLETKDSSLLLMPSHRQA